MDAEFIMLGMQIKFPWRIKLLELVIPFGITVSALYFWIGNVYKSGNAIKILQVICVCIQMCFLTAVAHLGYLCCAELGIRFACISEELRVKKFPPLVFVKFFFCLDYLLQANKMQPSLGIMQ